MMHFDVHGVKSADRLRPQCRWSTSFLKVAEHLRGGGGRLGLLLGHAGNRKDTDIEELARVAAEFRPDLVVVKENEAGLRGRAPGEVPQIIRAELLRLGFLDSAAPVRSSEVEAARCAIDWSRPGDVLALPLHSNGARAAVRDAANNERALADLQSSRSADDLRDARSPEDLALWLAA